LFALKIDGTGKSTPAAAPADADKDKDKDVVTSSTVPESVPTSEGTTAGAAFTSDDILTDKDAVPVGSEGREFLQPRPSFFLLFFSCISLVFGLGSVPIRFGVYEIPL
jgi:hypothetical protein